MTKRNDEYTKELNRLAAIGEVDPNWYTNHLKKQREAENKALEDERIRVKKIKCPVCKSTSKSFHSKGESNGIFGPGYHYKETDSYYVCQKCGVMYKDLNKPKK